MKGHSIPANERLIFAMDVPDCDRARRLAEELGATPYDSSSSDSNS